MPSNLILCHPFSCLQSFPASGSFLLNWFFVSSGQIIGDSASASVLPMNIQDWFPSGLTGLISLLSKGLSRIFSNTVIRNHQFIGSHPSLTHSSVLAWRILGTEEAGGSHRVRHDWSNLAAAVAPFFMVQLSHPHMATGKTIALTRWTFVGNVMSLFFNIPVRMAIIKKICKQ